MAARDLRSNIIKKDIVPSCKKDVKFGILFKKAIFVVAHHHFDHIAPHLPVKNHYRKRDEKNKSYAYPFTVFLNVSLFDVRLVFEVEIS